MESGGSLRYKSKQERSQMDRRINFFVTRRVQHRSRLPRQAVQSPSSEIFKSNFALEDKALSILVWPLEQNLLSAGGWTTDLFYDSIDWSDGFKVTSIPSYIFLFAVGETCSMGRLLFCGCNGTGVLQSLSPLQDAFCQCTGWTVQWEP